MKTRSSSIQRDIAGVRRAWHLTPPEAYRDPQWLKSAATAAAKAGRLPKRRLYGTVINQIQDAGLGDIVDHYAIVLVDGERHVIFEPYGCWCSMDMAQQCAEALAAKLHCRDWVSTQSWHAPGSTIRITLAPLRTVATDATNAASASDSSTS